MAALAASGIARAAGDRPAVSGSYGATVPYAYQKSMLTALQEQVNE